MTFSNHPHPAFALAAFLALSLAAVIDVRAQGPVVPAGTRFVMSHFKSNEFGGDERLYISVSPDALNWTALNGGNPVWQPAGWQGFVNVVRDPAIIHEGGWFWVAYTSGNYGNHASFGLVKSTDLLNWTLVGEISAAIPNATDQLTWGPSWFRDGDGSVHLFINISPDGGDTYSPVPNLRSYEMHPLNADFTAWSAPVHIPLPGGATNEFVVWKEGPTYHCIYVDFGRNAAYIHATSASLLSGWSNDLRLGFDSQEGGMVLKKPDGGYRFLCEQGNSVNPESTYRWCDFNSTFTTRTPQMNGSSTIGIRNGKMTAMPKVTLYSDWVARRLTGRPAADTLPNANPDGDEFQNALEYTMDLDPLAPDAAYLKPSTSLLPTGALALTHRSLPSLADGTCVAESGPGPSAFGASETRVQSRTLMSDGTMEFVTVDQPPAGAVLRLMRLRATLAP